MVSVEPRPLGDVLKHYRHEAGLTQEALAERAGVGVRVVSDMERGVQRAYRPGTITRLADALGLSPRDRADLEALALRRSGKRSSPPRIVAMRPPRSAGPPPPPLVGRAQELALLERHLDGEGPPLLALAGEPGIGKSRLLHEGAARAMEQGWQVLAGGCRQRGGQDAYAPLLDALASYIGEQTPARLQLDLQGCAWLARLLPELTGGLVEPPAALPPEQERRLMFDAVARFLANVAGGSGAVLLLDDLQWAGADALDLLAAVVRTVPAEQLRVVAAYRDNEVAEQDPLATMLADLAQARLVTHHTLAPLSRVASERLLDTLLPGLPPTTRGRVLQRAGGVPFVMVSCVQALRSPGHADDDEEGVPWDVAQGIRQRIAALPETAQPVLRAAAVIGRWAPRAVLNAVVERPEDEVLEALEAACHARLLEEDHGSDAYQFTHDVIREVIEDDIGAGRRTMLHRRIGAALEAQPGEPPVELLAYHYGHSDDQDKAILYLERAGDRARVQAANITAAEYYRDLVTRLDALGRDVDAARAREKLSAVLRFATRYDAALAALQGAVETYRRLGDLDGLGRTMAEIGVLHAERGTLDQGLATIQRMLAALEASEARQGLAMLYTRLAFLLFINGRYDAQLAAATRGAELAREAGDDAALANAHSSRGGALMMLGHMDEALAILPQASDMAEAAGDFDTLASILTNLATIHMYRGDFERCRHYTERSIEVVRRFDHPALGVLLMLRRAFIALFTGDWSRAREVIEEAIGVEQQIGEAWSLAYTLLSLGALCLLEGRWDEADTHLQRSLEIARRNGDIEAQRWVQSRLAERDVLDGHPERVPARFEGLLDRPGLEELDVTILLPRLAWAYLDLGDAAQAAELATEGVRRARNQKHNIGLADALWIEGMVAARQGRWADAERSLDEGVALTRRMPYPYAEARIHEVYGRMRAMQGEHAVARERLDEALAIFRRLGARRDAERVAGLLRSYP